MTTDSLPLTHPSFHRKALLLTLLAHAQEQLNGLALIADRDYDRPGRAEALGQVAQVSLTLRKLETLLQEALEI
jgi:hypothetical protein